MTTTTMSIKSDTEIESALEDVGSQFNVFRRRHEPAAAFTTRLIREIRERLGEMQERIARLENKLDRIRNIVS